MTTIDIPDAEARFFDLVEAVESGAEGEIIIARIGEPAARLIPVEAADPTAAEHGE